MATMLEQLDYFGKRDYFPIRYNNYQFLHKLTNSAKLRQYCDDILCGKYINVNPIVLKNVLIHMFHTDANKVTNIIYNSINHSSIKIKDEIDSQLNNKLFLIENFVNMYQTYKSRINKLTESLWYYGDNIRYTPSIKSYPYITLPYITLMGSYIFYKNVINVKYKYNCEDAKESIYLYDIFDHILQNKKININVVMSLYNMYHYYCQMSTITPTSDTKLHEQCEKCKKCVYCNKCTST